MPRPARAASGPDWKERSERSNVHAMRFMAWLSLRAGRSLSRAIVYAIAAYFCLFGGAARRASGAYLARVLGRAPTFWQRFCHVLWFATVTHDRIYFLKGRFALFDIRIQGAQEFARDHAQGIPLLLLGGHVGSFEALRAVGEKTGIHVSMLMYEENAAMINATLAALAPEPAPKVISLQRVDAMLVAQEDLRAGRVLGMLADRRLAHEPADVHTFLGAPAAFPRNPYRLANILQSRVYFMTALFRGGNRYDIRLAPLADFSGVAESADGPDGRAARIATAQAAYVKALESATRAAIYNWFNFFDFWCDEESAG